MTPAGIEPATFRFVAQHLNHFATAVPTGCLYPRKYSWYSFLLEAESTPGPKCDRKDSMSMKNSNDTSWDRTSTLTTVPPRSPSAEVTFAISETYPTYACHSRNRPVSESGVECSNLTPATSPNELCLIFLGLRDMQ